MICVPECGSDSEKRNGSRNENDESDFGSDVGDLDEWEFVRDQFSRDV